MWQSQCTTRPMVQRDDLCEEIRQSIQLFRMQSLENFRIDVFVHPPSEAKELRDVEGRLVGHSCYYLERWGDAEVLFYPFRDEHGNLRLRRSEDLQHGGEKSMSIEEYLKRLKPIAQSNRLLDNSIVQSEAALMEQRTWWRQNGKTFRLLNLPSELRVQIYKSAFGQHITPYPTHRARRLGRHTGRILDAMPNVSLFYVNRRISEEARNTLYKYTSFHVEHLSILNQLLSNNRQRQQIRQLQLCLSHEEYMELFHRRERIHELDSPKRSAQDMLPLMLLDRLEIFLAPPNYSGAAGIYDDSCQVKFVNHLLKVAWSWVRGHPVVLTGYVKDFQKTTFECRCRAERKQVAAWRERIAAMGAKDSNLVDYYSCVEDDDAGGVRVDGAEDMSQAGSQNEDEEEVDGKDLECSCNPACQFADWNPYN